MPMVREALGSGASGRYRREGGVAAETPRIDADTTALFLDFDGTLTEIAPTPDAVLMDAATRAALVRLAARLGGAVALVSGRPIADIDRHTRLDLPVAGGHGSERRDARGTRHAQGTPFDPACCAHLIALADREGLLVERKSHGLAVHYRNRPELGQEVVAVVDGMMPGLTGLRVIHGKMVVEILLEGADKGRALASYLSEPPFAGRRPLAVGDDRTDEDLFAAALAAGGTAIKIGEGPTCAPYRMPDTASFLRWLQAEAARLDAPLADEASA